MESPDSAAAVWPELLVSKAAVAIVVARNSLRVFIGAHFSSQASVGISVVVRAISVTWINTQSFEIGIVGCCAVISDDIGGQQIVATPRPLDFVVPPTS